MNDVAPAAGYENAPATKMLATSCCCCGRPLVDATSAELGIGPICRKKHGFVEQNGTCNVEKAVRAASRAGLELVVEDARAAANKVIFAIAKGQKCAASSHLTVALWHLGFTKLASIVAAYLGAVVVTEEASELVIKAPFSPSANAPMARAGARWHADSKTRRAPVGARERVFHAIIDAYPGHLLVGPKGMVAIPALSERP